MRNHGVISIALEAGRKSAAIGIGDAVTTKAEIPSDAGMGIDGIGPRFGAFRISKLRGLAVRRQHVVPLRAGAPDD